MGQCSVNDFRSFTLDNEGAALLGHVILYVLAGVSAKMAIDTLVAPSINFASWNSNGYALPITHNRTFKRLSRQKCWRKYHYHVLTISINGASKIVGHASRKMLWLSGDLHI
jgi:hypothetical protein